MRVVSCVRSQPFVGTLVQDWPCTMGKRSSSARKMPARGALLISYPFLPCGLFNCLRHAVAGQVSSVSSQRPPGLLPAPPLDVAPAQHREPDLLPEVGRTPL